MEEGMIRLNDRIPVSGGEIFMNQAAIDAMQKEIETEITALQMLNASLKAWNKSG